MISEKAYRNLNTTRTIFSKHPNLGSDAKKELQQMDSLGKSFNFKVPSLSLDVVNRACTFGEISCLQLIIACTISLGQISPFIISRCLIIAEHGVSLLFYAIFKRIMGCIFI